MDPRLPLLEQGDFALSLNLPSGTTGRRKSELYRQIRAAILAGRLAPSMQLPSTRALAQQLGLSRTTVVAVYEALTADGLVYGRVGGGTFANPGSAPGIKASSSSETQHDARLSPPYLNATLDDLESPQHLRFNFGVGLPDKQLFPFGIWRQLANKSLRDLERSASSGVPAAGSSSLRQAIASHLSYSRAIACNSEDIVVTSGAQQAMDLICKILVVPGVTKVAFENPGYGPFRQLFAAAGAIVVPVPVDNEGLVVDAVPEDAMVICVAPSNQMPLGVSMSHARRLALLRFAHDHHAAIVEDDYEGEFRFSGRPADALQTLGSDQVFYVGTFSKLLFPGLRLGFCVVPRWARGAFVKAKQLADWHAPGLIQHTLAAFISEGHLVRHLRRLRRSLERRRSSLVSELQDAIPTWQVRTSAPGLHLAVALTPREDANRLRAALLADGIFTQTFAHHWFDPEHAPPGLVLGFGAVPENRIVEGVRTVVATARKVSAG